LQIVAKACHSHSKKEVWIYDEFLQPFLLSKINFHAICFYVGELALHYILLLIIIRCVHFFNVLLRGFHWGNPVWKHPTKKCSSKHSWWNEAWITRWGLLSWLSFSIDRKMLSHEKCCRLSSISYNLPTIGGLQGCMVLKHPYGLNDVPHEYSQNS